MHIGTEDIHITKTNLSGTVVSALSPLLTGHSSLAVVTSPNLLAMLNVQ